LQGRVCVAGARCDGPPPTSRLRDDEELGLPAAGRIEEPAPGLQRNGHVLRAGEVAGRDRDRALVQRLQREALRLRLVVDGERVATRLERRDALAETAE